GRSGAGRPRPDAVAAPTTWAGPSARRELQRLLDRRRPSDLDCRPKAGRLRARILGDLACARPDRAPVDRAQLRLVAARADRELRRADAPALPVAKEALDDPVLER